MNKISKKIVALATMAAFVLTLVPAAAFAATTSVDWTDSYILTQKEKVKVDAGEPVDLELEIYGQNGAEITTGSGQQLFMWVEDENGITTNATFTYGADNEPIPTVVLDNGFAGRIQNAFNGRDDLHVSIADSGTYTIHAAVALDNGTDNPGEIKNVRELKTVDGQDTIVVRAGDAATVSAITVSSVTGTGIDADAVTSGTDAATVDMGDFLTNGHAKATVKGTAYFAYTDADNNTPARNTTLDLSCNIAGITLSATEVPTDRNGNFEFTFTLDRAGEYKVYIESDDYMYTLTVDAAEAATAEYITTTLDNGRVLEAENADVDFSDAVQFAITDKDGAELSQSLNEPAADVKTNADYVTIESKPDDSDLTAANIVLAWDATAGVYTIDYAETEKGDAKDDLIAGEYTVSIALESGNDAEATFTLAEAGDPVGLDFELTGDKSGKIDDTIVLGEKVTAYAIYDVDANGIRTLNDGKNVYTAVSGAVDKTASVTYFNFTASGNEDDLGKTITVQAFDSKTGKSAVKELTIVDGQSENTLSFEGDNGPANANNKVKVSVVDEEGDVVTRLSTGNTVMFANITEQSNPDAKVEVTPTNTLSAGKGNLTIFSDKETDLEILVTVVENPTTTNRVIYAGTLNYTVGANAPVEAETTVVMTIGSSDYVVNNDFVNGDAAPYIDSAWRTMVPFRVLGETFGATVNWDQDAQTVTYTLGDTELTMTIGEETYTVNGDEKTMDTAPVLSGDRTFVPVRFVAEALGYTVTPLQDANGLTASVVFQK